MSPMNVLDNFMEPSWEWHFSHLRISHNIKNLRAASTGTMRLSQSTAVC